jgi:hypothetical protein
MATNTLTGIAPKQKRISPLNGRVDTGMGVDPIGAPRVSDPTLFPGVAPGWTAEEVAKYKGGLGAVASSPVPRVANAPMQSGGGGWGGGSMLAIPAPTTPGGIQNGLWGSPGKLGLFPAIAASVSRNTNDLTRDVVPAVRAFGRALWTGSSEVPPPAPVAQPVAQPTVKPAATVSAPSDKKPPAAPTGPLALVGPQMPTESELGGKVVSGYAGEPETPIITGAFARTPTGNRQYSPDQIEAIMRDPNAGRMESNIPGAVNQGAVDSAKWADYNARVDANYQKMMDAQGGSQLGGLAGPRYNLRPSREERVAGIAASAEMSDRKAKQAMAKDVLAGQERMLGAKTASEERVAGLGAQSAAQTAEANRLNALEVARIRGPAGAGAIAKEDADQQEQAAALVGQIAELDATSPAWFGKGNSKDLAAQRKGMVAQLAALGYDETGKRMAQAEQAAGQSAAAAEKTATGKNGEKYVLRNGKWVQV